MCDCVTEVDDDEEEEDEEEAEEGFDAIVDKDMHPLRDEGPSARDIDSRRRLDEMLS